MPRFSPYGYVRSTIKIAVPNQILTGAALDLVTAWNPGYQFEIEKITYVAHTVHTGSSATKTFTIKKGSTTAGTVTAAVANVGTNGAIVAGTVTTTGAANIYGDSDTLTVSANAGTAFTLGAGDIYIVVRQRTQRLTS